MSLSKSSSVHYAFLEGTALKGVQPCSLEAFTLTYLKKKVSEAGFKYNDKGRAEYVDSCKELVDYDNAEAVTREEAASEAAYILAYSNTQIIDLNTRASVSTKVLDLMVSIIEEKLSASIAAEA